MKYLNPLRYIRKLINKIRTPHICLKCGHTENWHRILGCIGYCLCNDFEE